MSNVRGRIAVDVQFSDSTTATGVQSVKSLTLQGASEYDFGKVALISGTCGTAAVTVNYSPSAYKDSSGETVSFANVSRFAFAANASNASLVRCEDWEGDTAVYSVGGSVAVSDTDINPAQANFLVRVAASAGTASYTLVLYGS